MIITADLASIALRPGGIKVVGCPPRARPGGCNPHRCPAGLRHRRPPHRPRSGTPGGGSPQRVLFDCRCPGSDIRCFARRRRPPRLEHQRRRSRNVSNWLLLLGPDGYFCDARPRRQSPTARGFLLLERGTPAGLGRDCRDVVRDRGPLPTPHARQHEHRRSVVGTGPHPAGDSHQRRAAVRLTQGRFPCQRSHASIRNLRRPQLGPRFFARVRDSDAWTSGVAIPSQEVGHLHVATPPHRNGTRHPPTRGSAGCVAHGLSAAGDDDTVESAAWVLALLEALTTSDSSARKQNRVLTATRLPS